MVRYVRRVIVYDQNDIAVKVESTGEQPKDIALFDSLIDTSSSTYSTESSYIKLNDVGSSDDKRLLSVLFYNKRQSDYKREMMVLCRQLALLVSMVNRMYDNKNSFLNLG